MLIEEAIEKYYWEQENPFTVRDIQDSLKFNKNISCSYHQIRKIIKDNLKLSYKRCNSRPTSIDMDKIKLMIMMFSIDITQELDRECLFISCDEWSINKHTKVNYSWTKVGINKEIKNSIFRGSASIIMALFSNECWFAMVSNKTTNTQVFIYFLMKMIDWWSDNDNFGSKNLNLILDNYPYNKSKKAIVYLKTLKLKIYFLPPYSPSLALIELMFGWIKKKINKG